MAYMDESLQIAAEYAPYLLFDEKEPFQVRAIGYTIFRCFGKSDSFRRVIRMDQKEISLVIEYAIYFDYDIQHLYELEHVWVYVDPHGKVCGCEGSYHGKYINEMLPESDIVKDGTHVCLYSQPGKHALFPEKRLIYLFPDWKKACTTLAGEDGFAYPQELYGKAIPVTDEEHKMVKQYICDRYRFEPSMHFVEKRFPLEIFQPWEKLKKAIPQYMERELQHIREWCQLPTT